MGAEVIDHRDEPHQRRGDDVGRRHLGGAGEAAATCFGSVGIRAVQPVSAPTRGLDDGHITVGQGADGGLRSGDGRLGHERTVVVRFVRPHSPTAKTSLEKSSSHK